MQVFRALAGFQWIEVLHKIMQSIILNSFSSRTTDDGEAPNSSRFMPAMARLCENRRREQLGAFAFPNCYFVGVSTAGNNGESVLWESRCNTEQGGEVSTLDDKRLASAKRLTGRTPNAKLKGYPVNLGWLSFALSGQSLNIKYLVKAKGEGRIAP